MKKIRALVVDDEPLARKRIRTLLTDHQDVEIIGECSNGREASREIRATKPDLVFLDIQMPEVDGLEVVKITSNDHQPAFIFVTAYNEHAVQAFDINALDYLLKPFDAARFDTALQKARQRLTLDQIDRGDFELRMLTALEQIENKEFASRLVIKVEDRIQLLDVAEIRWIEAAGKNVCLHTADGDHLLRESMQHLESRVDPQQFVRIHRSTIVNLDFVDSFEPVFHGEYRVTMKDGTHLTLSRGYRAKLREQFGNLI